MPPSPPEPRNPFYLLLLLSCGVFILNALALGVVPVLEEKAAEAGNPPPPSAFRAAMRSDGWQWLLYEVAAVIVFAILSMVLDHLRRLKKDRAADTIPPENDHPST
jgi:hypothetical protein